MTDRHRLLASAFLRALATGALGVLLGLYLAERRLPASSIGLVVGAGLAGAAAASLLVLVVERHLRRRAFLCGLAVLGAAGTVAFSWLDRPGPLALAAFLGMLNGMGRDRGAALVLEQAVLPSTTTEAGRTQAFAWYNVLQDSGHALGSLLAVLPGILTRAGGSAPLASFRLTLGLCAAVLLAPLPLYLGLGSGVERGEGTGPARVSLESRRILGRLSALFALDSLGGGMLTTALLSLFFSQRFGVGGGQLGPLFFAARVANALSHLAAAWLAARIGLVRTMVLTHVPSSLLLVTVAFAPSFPVAAALLLLREGLVEMDVPTRQSYVMAVIKPEERAFASALTHLVRMGAWAVAPAFAGFFMQDLSLWTPLLVGSGLKLTYDGLLYAGFRRRHPPEEVVSVPSDPRRAGPC